jgi:hypothetical protein
LALKAVTWQVFASWPFADLLGLLTVRPALVSPHQKRDTHAEPARRREAWVLFAALTATMMLIVGLRQPLLAFW